VETAIVYIAVVTIIVQQQAPQQSSNRSISIVNIIRCKVIAVA
jgi:hypothetical protein